jgi:GntR family transcriptional regulator, transcriptional repressor for pyruvate dehydrogenase complex
LSARQPRASSAIRPVTRLSLSQQVARGLLQFIAAEPVESGQTLPSENDLAARFQVSRPIVREALKSLAATGVVQIVNGKGAVVQPLSGDPLRIFFERAIGADASAVRDLMELRRGIEVESAMLAAQRRGEADLERIKEALERMAPHLYEPDLYSELDLAFHVQIAAASHNTVLYHLVYSIRSSVLESMKQGFSRRRKEMIERTQEVHADLVARIEEQDVDGARLAMIAHFAVPLEELEDELRSPPGREKAAKG